MLRHKVKPIATSTINVYVGEGDPYGETTTVKPEALARTKFFCSDWYCKAKRMTGAAMKEETIMAKSILEDLPLLPVS